MKLTIAPVMFATTVLSATTLDTASAASCSGTSCSGTLSFAKEETVSVNAIATCANGQYPYLSSFTFRTTDGDDNEGISYETTYRTSSDTVATASACTSTASVLTASQPDVACGNDSAGDLKIRFRCNNMLDNCDVSWSFGFTCPDPPTPSPTPSPTDSPTESPTDSPTDNGSPTTSPTPSTTKTPTASPTPSTTNIRTGDTPSDAMTVAATGHAVAVVLAALGAEIAMFV